MSFDWNDFLNLAEELNNGNPTQAKMRTALSRAYYSAFIQCRNFLGFSADRKPEIHLRVINRFKESDDSTETSIGNVLFDLRELRSKADYDGFYVTTKPETKLNIDKAKSALNLLKGLKNP